MLYSSFLPALGSGLIWAYGPQAQAIAVGTTGGRRQAKSGDNQPWFPQLDRPSGHTQSHAATRWMRLKSGRSAGSTPPLTTSFAM